MKAALILTLTLMLSGCAVARWVCNDFGHTSDCPARGQSER